MTKVIIDNIDVSECDFINIRQECQLFLLPYNNYNKECRYCPNCYYKQLKHSQQDCEKLGTKLQQENAENSKLEWENNKFEKECEELKKKNEYLKCRIDELTLEVDTQDCQHKILCNGEYKYGCAIYENQDCNSPEFINCLFRQLARKKDYAQRNIRQKELARNQLTLKTKQLEVAEKSLTLIKNKKHFNSVDSFAGQVLKQIEEMEK